MLFKQKIFFNRDTARLCHGTFELNKFDVSGGYDWTSRRKKVPNAPRRTMRTIRWMNSCSGIAWSISLVFDNSKSCWTAFDSLSWVFGVEVSVKILVIFSSKETKTENKKLYDKQKKFLAVTRSTHARANNLKNNKIETKKSQ